MYKYYPAVDDFVLCVITNKNFECYTLDCLGPNEAVLNVFDFEGATKKTRPNLEKGALVYARVVEANKYLRTKVSCINPMSKKQLVTGEALFGELKGGVSFQLPLEYCKDLVQTNTISFNNNNKDSEKDKE